MKFSESAELMFIGAGLAMDAFAVALCKGMSMERLNMKLAAVIGLFFGGFQALMPFIGWLLGVQFERYITKADHWIAFILLGFIGGRMMHEAAGGGDGDGVCERLDIKELFLLAVATSIDALAVGITFAFLRTPIAPAVSIIGATTFALSVTGVAIGRRFGMRFKTGAEFAGGAVLILIGLKILLEHLGIISF